MSGTSENLAQWKVRLSEFGFDIFHSAGVKRWGAHALLRLLTCGTNKKNVNDDIAEFTITTDMFNTDEVGQTQDTRESYTEPTEQEPYLYLLELYARDVQVDESETSILNVRDFIEAQSAYIDCRQTTTSVRKLSSSLIYDTHRPLARIIK